MQSPYRVNAHVPPPRPRVFPVLALLLVLECFGACVNALAQPDLTALEQIEQMQLTVYRENTGSVRSAARVTYCAAAGIAARQDATVVPADGDIQCWSTDQ